MAEVENNDMATRSPKKNFTFLSVLQMFILLLVDFNYMQRYEILVNSDE
jgi:hypothetical protein